MSCRTTEVEYRSVWCAAQRSHVQQTGRPGGHFVWPSTPVKSKVRHTRAYTIAYVYVVSTRADVKCHPVLIIIWRRGFKPEIRTPLISVAIVKGRARKDAIGNSPIIATSGHALALPCRRSLVSGVLDEMMFCHVQFVASFFYVIRRVSVSLASSYCTSPCHFLLISVSKMPGGDRGRTYGTRSKTVARIADHTSRDLRIVFFRSNRIFESNRPVQSDNSCLHFTLTANI